MSEMARQSTSEVEGECYITAEQLAARVARSRWWVGDQARRGRIPHLRMGEPPPPNRRDTRPLLFTEQQAQQIEQSVQARSRIVEYVPSGGAA